MVTERELREAIDELEAAAGSINGCAALAALYALKDRYYPKCGEISDTPTVVHSASSSPHIIRTGSDSEFLNAINGKNWEDIVPLFDELMSAVKVLQPNLYAAVLRRL